MTKEEKKIEHESEQAAEKDTVVESQAEAISRKKIVFAEIDDEITILYDKLKNINFKHIYLVVPKKAFLFQSLINLKILKSKLDDLGKKLSLITNDSNGIALAQRLDIPVYDKPNSEGKPSLFSSEPEDEKIKITPLKATVNSIEEQAPTRLLERKLSISEILKKRNVKSSDFVKNQKKSTEEIKPHKKIRITANRPALVSLIAVSLVILLVILYIALPGATVYITPSASVLEKAVNITLADSERNKTELSTHPEHMIASYPIENIVEKTITQKPTGKKFSEKSKNATGKLIIYNTTNIPWTLIAKTRFQTENGLVYRITSQVVVPASNASGNGQIEIVVVADQVDAYGQVTGERGNIGPAKFFLPGLSEENRTKIFAESFGKMEGGFADYVSYISEDDIKIAQEKLKDELSKEAVKNLSKAVEDKSGIINGGKTYTLLTGDGAIKMDTPKITVPPDLLNKEANEFSISGTVRVTGVYYDHDEMLEILKNELMLKKSPQKELLRVNEQTTSYRIFEWDNNVKKIKLTANIKGIEQFEIDSNKENGQKLIQKIREHIAGKDIDYAKKYIQNLPEINKVEIDSWPAWAPTLPSLSENIDFEIREAIMVE